MRSRSMAVPAKPKIAGRRVSAAASTRATATIVAVARPSMNGRPTTNSPSRAMTTVAPAKSTARPAVDRATMVASRGGCRSASPCNPPGRALQRPGSGADPRPVAGAVSPPRRAVDDPRHRGGRRARRDPGRAPALPARSPIPPPWRSPARILHRPGLGPPAVLEARGFVFHPGGFLSHSRLRPHPHPTARGLRHHPGWASDGHPRASRATRGVVARGFGDPRDEPGVRPGHRHVVRLPVDATRPGAPRAG